MQAESITPGPLLKGGGASSSFPRTSPRGAHARTPDRSTEAHIGDLHVVGASLDKETR